MITRAQAYAAYLAMGDRRSLKGLRDKLLEDGVDPPAYGTLRTWSSAGQWRQRACEHESGVVVTVDQIIEAKAETRVELHEAAENAAAAAFKCVRRALEDYTPKTGEDMHRLAMIAIALANCSSALKQDGLRGAMPMLEGPFMAAQLAGDGGGIFELVKDHFLPPPDEGA